MKDIEVYENNMKEVRQKLHYGNVLNEILSLEEPLLKLFLIYYTTQGVNTIIPVVTWLERAGKRCLEEGFTNLGNFLIDHVAEERNHDRLMQRDSDALLAEFPDSEKLENLNLIPSYVQDYIDLHEENIASDTPYGQISIQYEIENLAPTIGVRLMSHIEKTCGTDYAKMLTFLSLHVDVDLEHSESDRAIIDDLLKSHPETMSVLLQKGENGLTCYVLFLKGCLDQAKAAHRELEPEIA